MPDLVVLSHLRWVFVWQRPQHLISRLARERRTWFVEEPRPCDVKEPTLRQERHGDVTRVWLEVPGPEGHVGFEAPVAATYADRLVDLVGTSAERTAWLYTPMALDMALALLPSTLVYDVMDDLASFSVTAPNMALRQREALNLADVVFTGGRSLHRMATQHRPEGTQLFPSGVEPEHFRPPHHENRAHQRSRPVAGYVGVIDERLDLGLLADLAHRLPDWEIQMVGPVLKIDPTTLPQAPNIRYLGSRTYAELPGVMAGFDVALMPFALNAATQSISPTKTLEYLAAGLPVVSTRVPDVVTDYEGLVDLQPNGAGFADACLRVQRHCPAERADKARPVLHWNHWDSIASRMAKLVKTAGLGNQRRVWPAQQSRSA